MPPKGGNSAVKRGKGKGQKRANVDPAQPNIISFFAAPRPTLPSPTATATRDEKAPGETTPSTPFATVDLTHNNAANASINSSSSSTPCGATSIDSATSSNAQGFANAKAGARVKQPKETAATSRAVALGAGGSATASAARNVFQRASELVKQAPTAAEVSIPRACERVEDDSAGGVPAGSRWRGGGIVPASELLEHDQALTTPAASMSRTASIAPNVSAATTSASSSEHAVSGVALARASSDHASASGSGVAGSTTPGAVETEKVRRSSSTDSKKTLSSWGSLGPSRASSSRPTARGTIQQRRPPRDHRPVHLPFHVVGLQFREATTVVGEPSTGARRQLEPNTTLPLEREPCNSHDANAIKVLLPTSLGATFLGYVPARVAVLLAPFLDAAPGSVARATVRAVGDGEEGEEEGGKGGGAVVGGGRQTLPAVLELQPLDGVDVEPFGGLLVKVRLLLGFFVVF